MAQLTFWYDFASNYAYLSAMRIEAMCAEANVNLAWKPFMLGPIFKQHGWESSPFNAYPSKGRYMRRDMQRLTEKYGLNSFKLPPKFPQNSLLAARICMVPGSHIWIGSFSRAVFEHQFGHSREIERAETLAGLLRSLHLPAASILEQAQLNPAIKDALRKSTQDAMDHGLFGAPSFTTDDGELFWGNDRLEDAIAWAKACQAP